MLHPDTELRLVAPEVGGYGVFATKAIPRGTLTWVPDDLDIRIAPEKLAAFPPAFQPILERYNFREPDGTVIVCWDFARFMNHSCAPTTCGLGTVCDVAVRDIQPGEQLTCEYALNNIEAPFDCHCGAPTCRGIVSPDALPDIAATLDAQIAVAFPDIARRQQPLFPYMKASAKARVERILSGTEPVPSCLENRG
jgi:hypothetical protein